MPLKVAAFYQFAALPDFRQLREPLRAFAAGLGLKGSVLLMRASTARLPEAMTALTRSSASCSKASFSAAGSTISNSNSPTRPKCRFSG